MILKNLQKPGNPVEISIGNAVNGVVTIHIVTDFISVYFYTDTKSAIELNKELDNAISKGTFYI